MNSKARTFILLEKTDLTSINDEMNLVENQVTLVKADRVIMSCRPICTDGCCNCI